MDHYTAGSAAQSPAAVTVNDTPAKVLLRLLCGSVYIIYIYYRMQLNQA